MSTSDSDLSAAPASEKPKLNLQVKIDKTSTCKRHVTVTVSREDIDRYFHEAFDEFVPKAEVAGFRPGRAPRKLVESRFREQMANQVKGSLLMDSVTQVSDEADFSAISEPDFDYEAVEMPEDGPLTFEFDIEVRPEFDLPEWKGLHLQRPTREYSDEDITRHLNKLLSRYGELVSHDGAISDSDTVTVRFVFRDGDQLLSELEPTSLTVKPVVSFRDGNLEGFDQLVIGKRPGERATGEATISDEAEREDLRGKRVQVDIEIQAVRRLQLPELNAGFLEQIGGFADEAELREAVRGELERQMSYYVQRQVRSQITSKLVKDANWDLPQDLLKRQYRRELDRAVLELRSSGFREEDIRLHQNAIRQNSMNATASALKEHFILERIAEENSVEADDKDYDDEIKLIAAQSEDSPRRVRARLEKRGQMDALRNQIIERKVIGLIMEHAVFTDVPFEQSKDDQVAVDQAISGHVDEVDIPEAKYGGEPTELPSPENR
ncbi:MAG: trigger factor [Pirellulaceae bacterium]